MRINILLLIGISLISHTLFGQNKAQILQDMRVDVVYLASDLLEGRETGTNGEALAAQYIASRLEKIGLTPKGTDGSWFQEFECSVTTNPHAAPGEGEKRIGKNVVGFLDNGADKTVVIGAHYDHLGKGKFGSRHTGEEAVHNGADDNASGIAIMIRLAAYLKQSEARNNNYIFIGFSGEELGLYGSKYYAANPTVDIESINYMFNMDMVGRLNEEKVLAISGVGTSPIWKTAMERIKTEALQIKSSDSGVGPSDYTSFYLKGIPVLSFFTGQHRDYHKPEDDSHLINYEGMYTVSEYMCSLIEALDKESKLTFIKTKEKQSTSSKSAFKVTLGIMPDYVSTEKGMRIDAVLADRPAQKAGLEDGDVLLKMGDMEINDIQDYMKALGVFEKGQKIKVVVKRGEKKVKKTVQF